MIFGIKRKAISNISVVVENGNRLIRGARRFVVQEVNFRLALYFVLSVALAADGKRAVRLKRERLVGINTFIKFFSYFRSASRFVFAVLIERTYGSGNVGYSDDVIVKLIFALRLVMNGRSVFGALVMRKFKIFVVCEYEEVEGITVCGAFVEGFTINFFFFFVAVFVVLFVFEVADNAVCSYGIVNSVNQTTYRCGGD